MIVWQAQTSVARSLMRSFGLEPWQKLGRNTFAIDQGPAYALVNQLYNDGYVVQRA